MADTFMQIIQETRRKSPVRESNIQRAIMQWLKGEGYFCYKAITCSIRGVPDIYVLVNGRSIFFEVKRPGGKTSDLQDYQIQRIKESGGYAFVVESVEEVKQHICRLLSKDTITL